MGEGKNSIFLNFFVIFWLIFCSYPGHVHSQCKKKAVIFNFGDSNSDTGGFSFGTGLNFGPPIGRIFFPKPSGRLCDGRLMIDHLCESVKTQYLTPFLESMGPNFTNGANFAISGSSTLPRYRPFNLNVQVLQFLRFRSRSLELLSKGYRDLVDEEGFENALYVIDIGQNDLAGAFNYLSFPQVIDKIPSFITEIKDAVLSIHEHGGRNFWIHNTGPLGCLPEKLATASQNSSELDNNGCLLPLNNAATEFNSQLLTLVGQLQSEFPNSTVVYVDVYAVKYELIGNALKYGFESPLMACCGSGGPPYNFDRNMTCGKPGCRVCEEGTKYVSWDGVHYTEEANSFFASKILSSSYSTPPIEFNFFCNS